MLLGTIIEGEAHVDGARVSGELLSLCCTEQLGRSFRHQVVLRTDDATLVDAAGLSMHVVLSAPDGPRRTFRGMVAAVEFKASPDTEGPRWYDVTLTMAPFTHVLELRVGRRAFVDKTVLEILDDVLSRAGLRPESVDVRLESMPSKRGMCMQSDETDFDFVCRLLEDEGLWFAYDHDAEPPRLIVTDHWHCSPRVTRLPSAPPDADRPAVQSFVRGARAFPHEVCVVDQHPWDATRALRGVHQDSRGLDVVHEEFPGGFESTGRGNVLATMRAEERLADARLAFAKSTALWTRLGEHVQIVEASDEAFAVVGTHLELALTSHWHAQACSVGASSCMDLDLVPVSARYRPPRLAPRPRSPGLQTAFVWGPEGEEIHTDDHGRVKLRFPWDDRAELGPSTAFVRVLQPGMPQAQLIPRVGWEVLVEFLDGDPDRPVVLGRLYNGELRPPVDLPQQANVSSLGTEATPGGAVVSEFVLDDTEGEERFCVRTGGELLWVAARHARAITAGRRVHMVRGLREEHVAADARHTVCSDEASSIGGLASLHVSAARDCHVHEHLSTQVGEDQRERIDLDDTLEVGIDARTRALSAGCRPEIDEAFGVAPAARAAPTPAAARRLPLGGQVTSLVGGNLKEHVGGRDALRSDGTWERATGQDFAQTIDGKLIEAVEGQRTDRTRRDRKDTCGNLQLTVDGDARTEVHANATIEVSCDLRAKVGGSYTLEATADVVLKGQSIDLKAQDTVVLTCGLAKLTLSPSGLAITGLSVTIEGDNIELGASALSPA